MSGKGSKRRPSFIGEEEYSLRWDLAFGYISQDEFDANMKNLRREKTRRLNHHFLKDLYE